MPSRSNDPRLTAADRWYASRIYAAYANRCWRCLIGSRFHR